MAKLTTHILDTARGVPAANVLIELWAIGEGDKRSPVTKTRTNGDGRTDAPLLAAESDGTGSYELVFHLGDYFLACEPDLPRPLFLDVIPIRFSIDASEEHYHVPLLVSPYAYATYRGS